MKLLLDTHVWLWAISEPSRLGPRTREALQSFQTSVYLSAVSSWEVAIKWRLGKLELPARPGELVKDSLRTNGFLRLDIFHEHGWKVADLPDHHRDPFDRLLVAQAVCERLTLLTADALITAYPCPVMWALD